MNLAKRSGFNPTLILAFCCFSTLYGSLALIASEVLTIGPAVALNCVALYAIYTATHEAAHGVASNSRNVNEWVGRVCALHEGLTFPMYRHIHFQHHRFTNHSDLDPDCVIGRKPRWLLPLWVLLRLLSDNSFMHRHGLWRRRRDFIEHVATIVLQICMFLLLALHFGWFNALLLWLVPIAVGGALVHLTVAWLVHHPHESMRPLEHTRLIKSRILQVLMLNQNLHLIHHKWPGIRWFEYGKHLTAIETLLLKSREHSRCEGESHEN